MKRIKTILVTVLIILLSVGFLPGRLVWADDSGTTGTITISTQATDTTPTPTPSDSPAPTSDLTPSPDPAIQTQTVDPTPTPTPDPSPSPSPCTDTCPSGDVTQQNQADVNNNVVATSDTGGNTSEISSDIQGYQATQSATVDPSGSAGASGQENGGSSSSNITTGNATTNVSVVNQVNTNLANSDYSYDVNNIYLDQNGNIDLSTLGASGQVPSALVVVKDLNNATVVNLIYASANSGQNTINGTGSIESGNAYVSANLLNFINTNFVNSTFHLVIFNIFGSLSGNIVLPDSFGQAASTSGTQSQNSGQGGQISQQNDAIVANSVQATSDTGQNGVSGGGQIQTGNATTAVNVLNLVNFNIFGGSFAKLIINNLGTWNGQFLGWGTAGSSDPIYGLMAFDFGSLGSQSGSCGCSTDISMTNSATVDNQVTATANTGGNNLSGGRVITGSAFAAANIFNFINANIINTKGFFGIINIFGTLNGDIGGASNFPQPTSDPGADSTDTNAPEIHAPGGALSTSISTNVGSHVNPGDTVMFFINAKNTGTGTVYDSKVTFNLYDSTGQIGAIQTFNIGKLGSGQTAKISFDLVLSQIAPDGTYSAVAQASGKVGPDDSGISSTTNTGFRVGLPLGTFIAGGSIVPEVLAASTIGDGGAGQGAVASDVASSYNWMEMAFMLLGYMGMLYIAQRLLVKPYRIAVYYFGKRRQWQQSRGLATASKFLSRFASGAMALRHLLF